MQAAARALLGVACAVVAACACAGMEEKQLCRVSVNVKACEILLLIVWSPRRWEEAMLAAIGVLGVHAFSGDAMCTILHFVAQAACYLFFNCGKFRVVGWTCLQLFAAYTHDVKLAHYAFVSMILLTRLYT